MPYFQARVFAQGLGIAAVPVSHVTSGRLWQLQVTCLRQILIKHELLQHLGAVSTIISAPERRTRVCCASSTDGMLRALVSSDAAGHFRLQVMTSYPAPTLHGIFEEAPGAFARTTSGT